jgi:hypothetical protein
VDSAVRVVHGVARAAARAASWSEVMIGNGKGFGDI